MTAEQRRSTPRPVDGSESTRGTMKHAAAAILIGLLTLLTQIVLRRELAPGEFGTLNALLGVSLVLVAPLAALGFVLRRALPAADFPVLLNRAALGWGIACIMLLLFLLPALHLSRESLLFYTLLAVGSALLAICGRAAVPARWWVLLGTGAALVRLAASAWCGGHWPVGESGLGALVLGCLVAGLPALRDQPESLSLAAAWRTVRPGLVRALAAIGVGMAIALFTNADRIVAQLAFTARDTGNLGFVDYPRFDEYQAAGLLARYADWALLPLLLLFLPQREALTKTTYASLRWLWIYLGALLVATLVLAFGGGIEQALFGGEPDVFLPGFAGAIFLLGLVQAVGVFALASRRHVECFVLTACSVAYAAFLFVADQPQLLTTCMAGGALVSLALVLLVGVVRYARSHP